MSEMILTSTPARRPPLPRRHDHSRQRRSTRCPAPTMPRSWPTSAATHRPRPAAGRAALDHLRASGRPSRWPNSIRRGAIRSRERVPRARAAAAAATLVRVVLQCYYRDDRVLRSLGLELRAPFPQGVRAGAGRLVAARSRQGPAFDPAAGAIAIKAALRLNQRHLASADTGHHLRRPKEFAMLDFTSDIADDDAVIGRNRTHPCQRSGVLDAYSNAVIGVTERVGPAVVRVETGPKVRTAPRARRAWLRNRDLAGRAGADQQPCGRIVEGDPAARHRGLCHRRPRARRRSRHRSRAAAGRWRARFALRLARQFQEPAPRPARGRDRQSPGL